MDVVERRRAACLAAYEGSSAHFKELSGVMSQDIGWDILQRNGCPNVCLGGGHRFFFVLFLYHHWRSHSGTADFGVCTPQVCDEVTVRDEILPAMYSHFFDFHTDFLEDGQEDEARSLRYSLTLKEYRPGLVITDEMRGQVLWGAAICLVPPFLASLWDESGRTAVGLRHWWFGREAPPRPSQKPALLVEAFSLRRGLVALLTPGPLECAGLCRLRVCLTVAMLTLHVTQGSKWHAIGDLERRHPIFAAVRPLALVNDAFLLLSTYLCAWGAAREEAQGPPAGWPRRLRHGLVRALRKYARQLPLCLLWVWLYVCVFPGLPYNMYNHSYPWFGVKWFQRTGKCMMRKWRYAFLLGDVGALLLGDADNDWNESKGNPCGNLWNFQLEIEAFTASTCLLMLPRHLGNASLAALLALGASALALGRDLWLWHHARGVSFLLLLLRALGLPHVGAPPPGWRVAVYPATTLALLAVGLHGILEGGWLADTTPRTVEALRHHREPATVAWQAALAAAAALGCESLRCSGVAHGGGKGITRMGRQDGKAPMAPPGPCLTAASRLSFGANVAHLFVQFVVEAHVSLDIRIFSLFSWLTQLLGIAALSLAVACAAFLLVQRPWAVLLGALLS